VFDEGKVKLLIPARAGRMLKDFAGRKAVLGVRPEDIRLPDRRPAAGLSRVPLTVELVEPMGNEVVLHATTGIHPVVARLDSSFAGKPGVRSNLPSTCPKPFSSTRRRESPSRTDSHFDACRTEGPLRADLGTPLEKS